MCLIITFAFLLTFPCKFSNLRVSTPVQLRTALITSWTKIRGNERITVTTSNPKFKNSTNLSNLVVMEGTIVGVTRGVKGNCWWRGPSFSKLLLMWCGTILKKKYYNNCTGFRTKMWSGSFHNDGQVMNDQTISCWVPWKYWMRVMDSLKWKSLCNFFQTTWFNEYSAL